MQIIDIPLGAEGNVEVDFSAGVFVIKASENTPGLQGSAQINIPVTYFIDAIVGKLGSTPAEVAVAQLVESIIKGIA